MAIGRQKARRNFVSNDEVAIWAYQDFKIDKSLDHDDHIQSVHHHWLVAKNVGYEISNRQAISDLLETLSPHERRLGKIILKKMLTLIPEGGPKDLDFVDFCNGYMQNWKNYVGDVISHSRSESTVTSNDVVMQPIEVNANEKEDLEDDSKEIKPRWK
ncbi:hypothetical protein Fot_03928 [Forsythia ovata]|uniref:Uncharacterized protein n=1 Tax=Forsythia ovata TaxID=205694 RepID=A0ABD1XB86_9LAMI